MFERTVHKSGIILVDSLVKPRSEKSRGLHACLNFIRRKPSIKKNMLISTLIFSGPFGHYHSVKANVMSAS